MADKNKDGLLGALLSQAMRTGALPGIPGLPALTAANAVLKYAVARRQAGRPTPAAPARQAPSSNVQAKPPPTSVQTRTPAEQAFVWLNHNPLARQIAGGMASQAGVIPGVARGLVHTAGDIGHAAWLGSSISSPLTLVDPSAYLARQQLMAESMGMGLKINEVMQNPKAAFEEAKQGLRDWRASIDPSATPEAKTTLGEILRRFPIGVNQGELAFDVGSLAYGGAELKGLRGMRLMSGAPTAANYIAQKVPAELADYFALPYTGRGHHYWPVRKNLPDILGGGPMPKAISESPFFLLRPKGITNGEFYKLHHAVDPYYYGGKVRKGYPARRWSAKDLEWEKYGTAGQLWHGAPLPLKMAVTSPLYVGAGIGANMLEAEEDSD